MAETASEVSSPRTRRDLLRLPRIIRRTAMAVLISGAFVQVLSGGSAGPRLRDPLALGADAASGPHRLLADQPDLAGPAIGTPRLSAPLIREVAGPSEACRGLDQRVTIAVEVVDESGVREVDLEFRAGETSGGMRMLRRGSSEFVATLGDFLPRTVTGRAPLELLIVATDETRQTTRRVDSSSLSLQSCGEGS